MLKSILIKISILSLLVLCSAAAFAEEQQAAKNEPIQIEADNMKYYGDKQMSHFTGNVVVIKGDLKMTSKEMEVYFTEEKEVKEIFSKGDVKIEREGLLALSGFARIYQQEQKVVLTENARVWQEDNYLEGDKVTLFLDSEKLFVDKGNDDDKRVKIIITPQKENK
jgi:lipopolysaccharide export system protein LptA